MSPGLDFNNQLTYAKIEFINCSATFWGMNEKKNHRTYFAILEKLFFETYTNTKTIGQNMSWMITTIHFVSCRNDCEPTQAACVGQCRRESTISSYDLKLDSCIQEIEMKAFLTRFVLGTLAKQWHQKIIVKVDTFHKHWSSYYYHRNG